MEPKITINGQKLNEAQAMTVRVAVTSFAFNLVSEGLGDDKQGKKMAALYLERIREIYGLIYKQT